jgi:hypothetical protein
MIEFSDEDVGGKPFLLPMLREAYRNAEYALREANPDGGQVLDLLLEQVADGMRRQAREFAGLFNTESAAKAAHAERALYEVGLVSAGVSPVTLKSPARYCD